MRFRRIPITFAEARFGMEIGVRVFAFLFACLLIGSTAKAAQPISGCWSLDAGGRIIMLLELHRSSDGKWSGSFSRPQSFQLSGTTFTDVRGPVLTRPILEVRESAGDLELKIGRPNGATTTLIWAPTNAGGELSFVGAPFPPLPFRPAAPEDRVASEWDPNRAYLIARDRPSSAEMAAIFDADQAARQNPVEIEWAEVGRADLERRARTKALLDAGQLRSGADYLRAAFVLQHGDEPQDFLLAHTLATIALARGRPDATWIAAATLDRYLQSIGQKQIYGTQFSASDNTAMTQEPYDRNLVSDALRAGLGVPSLGAQEVQRKDLEAKLTRDGEEKR